MSVAVLDFLRVLCGDHGAGAS